MNDRRRAQPVTADQAFDAGEVVTQRLDAALEYGIAVHLKAGLRGEGGQFRGGTYLQGLDEGVLEVFETSDHCVAPSRSSMAWACARSPSNAVNAGTLSSRSISVGRGPMRWIKR